MKKIAKKIIITLLFLTPIGYLMKLFNILSGEVTPGVYLSLETDEPIEAVIKKNPQVHDRIQWFINGVVLLIQSIYVFSIDIFDEIGGSYAWIAFLYATINIISALFPKLDWNKKLSLRKN
jgi:hypothetical protein